jgi:hypothetical protein
LENLAAHQERALGVHLHDRIPALGSALVQGAVTLSAGADPSNVHERVNPAKALEARGYTTLDRSFIAYIADEKTVPVQIGSETAAAIFVYPKNKNRICHCPHARDRSRNSRRTRD